MIKVREDPPLTREDFARIDHELNWWHDELGMTWDQIHKAICEAHEIFYGVPNPYRWLNKEEE